MFGVSTPFLGPVLNKQQTIVVLGVPCWAKLLSDPAGAPAAGAPDFSFSIRRVFFQGVFNGKHTRTQKNQRTWGAYLKPHPLDTATVLLTTNLGYPHCKVAKSPMANPKRILVVLIIVEQHLCVMVVFLGMPKGR